MATGAMGFINFGAILRENGLAENGTGGNAEQ